MILLSAEKISKSYSEKKLLQDVSLYLCKSDKIGVIGVNGTGKSTLLNILKGVTMQDQGTITLSSGSRISYLEQNPIFDEDLSILENVFLDSPEETKILKEFEAKSILMKMGFNDLNMNINTLSGGEKKKIALAKVLVSPSEILILDEPTNHLDIEMVTFLENYLKNYNGAIIMVTHDRYFLDRVTNKIMELSEGNLYTYNTNYTGFLKLKSEREEMELATNRKNRSLYKKELEWMKQGPKARGTKSKDRMERFNKLSSGIVEEKNKLKLDSISSRLGKKVVEINNISKSYGEVTLISNFSHIVLRDERLGIIGKNGTGKSTLLKIIKGEIPPDDGEIIIGDTVKIGYFKQEWVPPKDDVRVIEYIRDVSEYIKTKDGTISASQMLEKFLFSKDSQWNLISKLSGGEKRRLNLLKVLMSAPNVLLLDEPTNDLDIETLTILEEYLEDFQGAILVISHDRYFLDKISNYTLEFTGEGSLTLHNGGYTEYFLNTLTKSNLKKQKSVDKKEKPTSNAPKKLKFTFKENLEFENIEGEIENLENKLTSLEDEINNNSSDFEKLQILINEKEETENNLNYKMERWVYLNDLAEKIQNENE